MSVVLVGILMVASGSFYTVHETEQVIITEFGKRKGDPITEAGLKFKVPFIQKVNRIEKRVLEWDGSPSEMPTKDKLYIVVDTFARWRISDPLKYFLALTEENSAQNRLGAILGSETRNAVAKHNLIEIIRTTKDREVMAVSDSPTSEDNEENARVGKLEPIAKGRSVVEAEIKKNAVGKLAELGIELLDIRFKRINYNVNVRNRIYERMISERQQIAELFRSEGAAEAARILGNKEFELKKIESEAYKTIQQIRGEADAKATGIYAGAYNLSPAAAEFYEFLKTMETYESVLAEDTTVVLSTESDLFRFLKRMPDDEALQDGGAPVTPRANQTPPISPGFPAEPAGANE